MTPGYTRYVPTTEQPASASGTGWIVVSGRSFVAALAAGAAARVIDELWRLARQEAVTVEAVVGAIPLAGATAVPSFAIVSVPAQTASTDGCTVTAVVRGAASVDVVSVGGARRFWAAELQPWVLADFRSVTGFVIGGEHLPAEVVVRPGAAALPLGEGVVVTSRLFWSQQEQEQEQEQAPAVVAAGYSALDETIVSGRRTPAVAPSTVVPDAVTPDSTTVLDDDTVLHAPRGEAGPTSPSPTPAPTAPTTPSAPPAPSAPEPVAAAPARFRFRIVPGEPFELDAPTFFGRKPRAPGTVSGVAPRVIVVVSPRHQVSGTHLRVEQLGDSVVVTDLRSTNGTVVSGPGIAGIRLRPGESRVVLPGTTIDIGDGNIIEIVPPHES